MIGTILGSILGFAVGMVQSVQLQPTDSVFKRGLVFIGREVCRFYVWIFRGTPMMVQAMMIYYGPAQLFDIHLPAVTAGLLVLSLNTGAYMAETVRGGILSVDPGQMEGAATLGMTHYRTMMTVTLPQAFRNILPQIGNNLVSCIKDSSVLSVITVNELFYASRAAAGTYFKFFEVFFVTCLIYLVLTSLFTWLMGLVEKWVDGRDSYELVSQEAIDQALAGNWSSIRV